MIDAILNKAREGSRLSREEIISLLGSRDLLALGGIASELARKRNQDRQGIVTYIVDRNINYSNVCVSGCRFCAFYREKGAKDAFLLSWEEIRKKIEETVELGGIQILLQGGLHPDLNIDYYIDLLTEIKTAFPSIHIHGFSPPEILHISKLSKLAVSQTIAQLKEAGLDSIPGGGAEVLSDAVRSKISPEKCAASQWLAVMETAHNAGLKSSATMMFGHLESPADIADHLLALRGLQDKTNGFTAFIPWTFQPGNTELGGGGSIGGFDYLRMVAVSRIALDNFKHIQVSWVTQGAKVAQVALFFGADDMGSTMIEENVVKAAGVSFRMSAEEISSLVQDAGLRPMRRRNDYSLIET
ncbi:MAG: dehypoxanthine futalosine cyclase [Nitrospinae bacterium]|nr:dehypoxanthine futalosine cyclase [Nitrospinota bacterium]